ncbi:CmeU family protein [Campylobacter jejuni]|uniref:CmeU family protein n=1 Tax=Campylobacter jejuni TaxID=197 RepID=UPI0011A58144|nr:CmeU family protein [Campylobacter jejuni]
MDKAKIVQNLNALFKQRAEFYSYFDKNIAKINNTEVFDFKNAKNLNPEEVYKQFYHFDYAIRKLLPTIYKAYEITDADLDKDF